MGILGEAMRAGRPILAVPRTGPTTADNPANDQRRFLGKLAQIHPIEVCLEPASLLDHLRRLVRTAPDRVDYQLQCDVPAIVGRFLSRSPPAPARTMKVPSTVFQELAPSPPEKVIVKPRPSCDHHFGAKYQSRQQVPVKLPSPQPCS